MLYASQTGTAQVGGVEPTASTPCDPVCPCGLLCDSAPAVCAAASWLELLLQNNVHHCSLTAAAPAAACHPQEIAKNIQAEAEQKGVKGRVRCL